MAMMKLPFRNIDATLWINGALDSYSERINKGTTSEQEEADNSKHISRQIPYGRKAQTEFEEYYKIPIK